MLPSTRFACAAVVLAASPAVLGQQVQFTAITGSATRLAPGETGTLRLRVQSEGLVWTRVYSADAADGDYDFSLIGVSPGCPTLEPQSFGASVMFDPTVAGGDLECAYSVHRAVSSINDQSVNITPMHGPVSGGVALRFGAVPEMRLDVRQDSVRWLPDGRAQNELTITVQQSSTVALSYVAAGFCLMMPLRFEMSGSLRNGCDGPAPGGGFCFNGGYQFNLPVIPAQQAITCRVQLTSRETYTARLSYPIKLITLYMHDAATGGRVVAPEGPFASLVLDMDLIFTGRFE